MKAIGKDGQWHDWNELSAEEQSEWMEAMTEADNIYEHRKYQERVPTLKQNIARYEQNERFIY